MRIALSNRVKYPELEHLPKPAKPQGDQPRMSDRAALTGILFVLKSGIAREMLPQEFGCGSGMTCWRRLSDGQQAGVLGSLTPDPAPTPSRCRETRLVAGLARLSECRGHKGGAECAATEPNPTDRGKLAKPDSKHHLVVDADGIPLAVRISAANVHDSQMLGVMLDAIPPLRQPIAGVLGRVGAPPTCTPTKSMITRAVGRPSASVASSPHRATGH